MVGTEIGAVEPGIVRRQQLDQATLHGLVSSRVVQAARDPRLVGDGDHEPARLIQLMNRLPRACEQSDFAGLVQETRVLQDRKSTRLNSSHTVISYAVFCLKKKTYPLATASSTHTHHRLVSTMLAPRSNRVLVCRVPPTTQNIHANHGLTKPRRQTTPVPQP